MKKKKNKVRNPLTIPAKRRKAGEHKPKSEKRKKNKDNFLDEELY